MERSLSAFPFSSPPTDSHRQQIAKQAKIVVRYQSLVRFLLSLRIKLHKETSACIYLLFSFASLRSRRNKRCLNIASRSDSYLGNYISHYYIQVSFMTMCAEPDEMVLEMVD